MKRALALAALVACGTPPPAGTADAHVDAVIRLPDAPAAKDPCVAPIALDDLGTCLDRAWCARLAACGFGALGDTDCARLAIPIVGALDARTLAPAGIASSVDGEARYDAVAAAACVAAVGQTDCRTISPQAIALGGCALFDPQLGPGAGCGYPYQCAGDAACERMTGGGFDPACGSDVCKARVGVGEACSQAPCAIGAHCLYRPIVGVSCVAGDAGSACNSDDDCDPDLFCDHPGPVADGSGACTPAGAADAPCTRDGQCAGALLCVGEAGGSGGTCVDTRAPGARCDTRCLGPRLCAVTAPDVIGACVDAPAIGEPCVPGAGCGMFLRCGADDRCAARGAIGDACAAGADCALGLICTADVTGTSSGTCVAPLPDGTACYAPDQCASGACTDHVCEPFAACS